MSRSLSLGTDIVDVGRIDRILNKSREKFLNRIFTTSEISYIESKAYRPETVAGIFAAKEAVAKAIGFGIGKVNWKDIEINYNKYGKPSIKLYNRDRKVLESFKNWEIEISISHEKTYAFAVAILYKI